MSPASAENPYQSPQTTSTIPTVVASCDWKEVLRRWEFYRLFFNLIVGAAGLFVLVFARAPGLLFLGIVFAVFYGIAANIMYFFGPIGELYLNWLADAWQSRFIPSWACNFIRSRHFTSFLFAIGCLFSVALTLAIGVGVIMEYIPTP